MKDHGFERWLTPSDRERPFAVDPEASKPTLVQSPAHLLESERAPRTIPRMPADPALSELERELDQAASAEAAAARLREEAANDDPWSPQPRADEPSYIGQLIDNRYVVEALIARGGMGIVYRCRHQLIDRKFAVKIIRSTMANLPDAPRRFLMEAKAASAIGNEHIVDVVDYGTLADGSAYLVMELLEGVPLSDIIARHETLPLPRITTIASQVCEALHAAHQAGIIHRDLKPENIFLAQRKAGDFVKILDFGIAKMVSSGESLTKRGMIVGTPHYMSPEQAAGAPVDARGDIYSLGVILFELATGQVPFDATHYMAVLAKHLSEPPPPFDSLSLPAKLPADFEAIVQRCLAKRPDQRFQTMLEVMEATDRLGRRLSPLSPPPASEPALPQIVPPHSPLLDAALAPRELDVVGKPAPSSAGSLPATAQRSGFVPPSTRGVSLLLSAAGVLALVGISILRMQAPAPATLHDADLARAAALADRAERAGHAALAPASADENEASALSAAEGAAAAPGAGRSAAVQAEGAPGAGAESGGAQTGAAHGDGAQSSGAESGGAQVRAAQSGGGPTSPLSGAGGAPAGSPALAATEPLTVVELAPGKSVEIEARTRLSLRLTKDAEDAKASTANGSTSRRSSARSNPPKPERSTESRDPSGAPPEAPAETGEPNGLMNPWPTPGTGATK